MVGGSRRLAREYWTPTTDHQPPGCADEHTAPCIAHAAHERHLQQRSRRNFTYRNSQIGGTRAMPFAYAQQH